MSESATGAIRFELSGAGVQVDYLDSTSAQLRYRDEERDRVLAGGELRIETTVIGTLATGTLESIPDLGNVTVTLAVPGVNLPDEGSAEIETVLIRTRHRTSIGGPALVDGALEVYECVPLTGTATAAEGESKPCRDWDALHDLEPPGPGRLRVTGRCTVPTPDHRVELRRKEPQGANPADLLLDRIVYEPKGPVIQVETDVDVEYAEETDAEIATVTVLPDGVGIPVRRVV